MLSDDENKLNDLLSDTDKHGEKLLPPKLPYNNNNSEFHHATDKTLDTTNNNNRSIDSQPVAKDDYLHQVKNAKDMGSV